MAEEPFFHRSINGTFTEPGISDVKVITGFFNPWLGGTWVGTVELQRRLVGQSTFHTIDIYTAVPPIPLVGQESDKYGAEYRWECTAFTSGEIEYRISQ